MVRLPAERKRRGSAGAALVQRGVFMATSGIMKKDSVYSIRMSAPVRQGLTRAARSERRTVASLLDKIIIDYLETKGFIRPSEIGSDRRRCKRKPVTLPAVATIGGSEGHDAYQCVILDISLGGVLLVCPKGCGITDRSMEELSLFELRFTLTPQGDIVSIPCQVRRINNGSKGIILGAMFREPGIEVKRALQQYLL